MKRVVRLLTVFLLMISLSACAPKEMSEKTIVNENIVNVIDKDLHFLDEIYYAKYKTFKDEGKYLNVLSKGEYDLANNRKTRFKVTDYLDSFDITYEVKNEFTIEDINTLIKDNILVLHATSGNMTFADYLVYGVEGEFLFFDKYMNGEKISLIGSLKDIKKEFKEYNDPIELSLIVANNSIIKERYPYIKISHDKEQRVFSELGAHYYDATLELYLKDEKRASKIHHLVSNLTTIDHSLSPDKDILKTLNFYGIPYKKEKNISLDNLIKNLENNYAIIAREYYYEDIGEYRYIVDNIVTGVDTTINGYLFDNLKIGSYMNAGLVKLDYAHLINYDNVAIFYVDVNGNASKLPLEELIGIKEVVIPNYILSESKHNNITKQTYFDHRLNGKREDKGPCTKVQAFYLYNYLHPYDQISFETEVKKNDWYNKPQGLDGFIEKGYFSEETSTNEGLNSPYDFMLSLKEGNLISVPVFFKGMKDHYTLSANDHDGIGYDGEQYSWLVNGVREDERINHEVSCYGFKFIDDKLYFMFYDAYDYPEFVLPVDAFFDGTVRYPSSFTWKTEVPGGAKIYYEKNR